MKTKKVVVNRTSSSFSTAATYLSTVTLARAPWDTEPDPEPPQIEDKPLPKGPRHLGSYTRRDKT